MKQSKSNIRYGWPRATHWWRLVCVLGISGTLLMSPELALAKSKEPPQQFLKGSVSAWRESKDEGQPMDDIELSTTFPDQHWWYQFGDPNLDKYIAEAIMTNHEFQVAAQRVQEAEALAQVSLGKELPSLALSPNFSRLRNSKNSIPTFRSGSSSTTSGSSFLLGQYINSYSLPLAASYEPDFWLKNRDKTKSLKMTTEALKKDMQATMVLLATNVAGAYFNLMAADELIDLQTQQIQLSEDNLQFAQNRLDAGAASEEELAIRQGMLANENARLQSFQAQKALALNTLALLLGRTTAQVNELPRKSFTEYALSSKVEAGVPAELLVRRPDILAAEKRLAAANIDIRVARKEFLPSFTLTGQFGFASAGIGRFMQWDSYLTSVAAGFTQSLFSGGQKKAGLKVAKSRYEQAVHNYQQTVLQAFKEVDDSLAMYKADRRSFLDYQNALTALDTRVAILNNRVREGVDSEADLVPVQLEATTAKTQATQAKLSALIDTLSLYKSVGGGY